MMELSWLLWKYMATSNSISPKEADTPAALQQEEDTHMQTLDLVLDSKSINKNKELLSSFFVTAT